MFTSSRSLATLLTVVLAGAASAQTSVTTSDTTEQERSEFARRSSGSISFIQSRPQGAFRQNIGFGYGADAAYLIRLDDAGVWSIRANVGVLAYGSESKRTPLSESVGGRVLVDVTTTNYIVPMSIGPQLSWPTGRFRPYVNAGIGGQAFVTESHVDGSDDWAPFASTTNHSAFAALWAVGGGVYMPVYEGSTKVEVDMGMQYLSGARASYLARGSIVDLPGAQIRVTPLESTTHQVIARVGLRVRL